MADLNPVSFLLNQGSEAKDKAVVEAPAFSLTKVLTAGSVIVAPIATYIVDKFKDQGLTAQHYVVLTIGLLGFLAITAAADVLARSLATAAEKNARAAAAAIAQFTPFQAPLGAQRIVASETEPDREVEVLAVAQAEEAHFLVKEGDSIAWMPASKIRIPPKRT
jgi:hypothetical protein